MQNGIVDAGYRGELLSKILCLMAMDDTPKLFPDELVDDGFPYFQHTQPVKVKDFVNKWLAAPSGKGQFTDALYEKNICTDSDEFERFLNGYVFFNNFVRLERIASMEAIVCTWNRGAAIMPKEIIHATLFRLCSRRRTEPQPSDQCPRNGVRKTWKKCVIMFLSSSSIRGTIPTLLVIKLLRMDVFQKRQISQI